MERGGKTIRCRRRYGGILPIEISEIVAAFLTLEQRFSGKPAECPAAGPHPMPSLLTAHQKKFYRRATVACQKCAAPILVYKLNALPDEFSLRCSKCGARGYYLKRGITIEELPERRKKPRK
jgi:hypothetical protein